MKLERKGSTVFIKLEEDLSFATILSIKDRINQFIRHNDKKIVLNISNVEFIDSRGLGLIISIYKRVKMLGGEFVLEYPKLGVQKLIEMTRLDQLFKVVKTPEEKTGDWKEFE